MTTTAIIHSKTTRMPTITAAILHSETTLMPYLTTAAIIHSETAELIRLDIPMFSKPFYAQR